MQIAYPMEKGDRGDKSKAPVGEIVDPRHCCGFSREARSIDEVVPILEHHPCHRLDELDGGCVVAVEGDHALALARVQRAVHRWAVAARRELLDHPRPKRLRNLRGTVGTAVDDQYLGV